MASQTDNQNSNNGSRLQSQGDENSQTFFEKHYYVLVDDMLIRFAVSSAPSTSLCDPDPICGEISATPTLKRPASSK